jgi:prolyl-tRNA synthetase
MYSFAIHTITTQLTHTLRSHSESSSSKNARLLTRAGYVSQCAAGIYTLMPLAIRVLGRIESIVREEMNALGAHELLVPGLQPRDMWDTTGRWDSVDVLYKLTSRHGAEYCLGATAEEGIVAAFAQSIRSHRDLPTAVFQISTKYRDEHRARSGLLRGRDFRMKDLYSLHLTQAQLDEYYEDVCKAYARIFERCGIGSRTVRTFASGGVFSRFSDEFQLLHDAGEDTVFVTEDRRIAINKEIAEDAEALRVVFGGTVPQLLEHRAIEVGNTFKLGSRFTDAFGMRAHDAKGESTSVLMCSYGIGTTRLLGAVAEVYGDDDGLVWTKELSPYDLHLVQLGERLHSNETLGRIKELCRAERLSLLIDDREEVRAGEKFADADLIGIPLRVVIGGNKSVGDLLEVKQRRDGKSFQVALDELARLVRES